MRHWPCPNCGGLIPIASQACAACSWRDTTDGYEAAVAMIAARWPDRCPALSAEACREIGLLMQRAWVEGKPIEAVAEAITRDPSLAQAFGRYRDALELIVWSVEKLRAHLARQAWHAHIAMAVPGLKQKWHFSGAPSSCCDGSCQSWANGGQQQDGIYPAGDAPTPNLDTHLGCTCIVGPSYEDVEPA